MQNKVSPERDVILLARRRVLPPGELLCAAVECYRRRQTTTTDASEQNNTGHPTLCVGGPLKLSSCASVHAWCNFITDRCQHDAKKCDDSFGRFDVIRSPALSYCDDALSYHLFPLSLFHPSLPLWFRHIHVTLTGYMPLLLPVYRPLQQIT